MTESSSGAGTGKFEESTWNVPGFFGYKTWIAGAVLLILLILFVASHYGLKNFPGVALFTTDSSPIQLVDMTARSGLDSHVSPAVYNENPGYLEVMGGGVAVGDFDGDGWEDIFFATMPSFDPRFMDRQQPYRSALYRNQGDGTFKDVTDEAGLGEIKGYPMGALFFDYNNNGRQDLYVASYNGGQLFRNEGGYFVDVTESAGLSLDGLCGSYYCLAAAASAGDYNRSGYLDILIVNNVDWDLDDPTHYGSRSILPHMYRAQQSFLFRNNGDGTFTDVSHETGVTNLDPRGYSEDGKGLSAIWFDFNNNGWPDIYIANDMTPNRLYMNNRDGTFSEMAVSAQVDEGKSSMGVDATDYNYSGNMDIVITNLEGSMTTLFRNYGDLRFDYATTYTGLIPSGWGSGWGILFVDLDLDGYPDLVMASGALWEGRQKEQENQNIFFRNLGISQFKNISEDVVNFPNNARSRGMAVIDVHRSGKPDLIISNIDGSPPQLLLNRASNNHNWIRLDLEGVHSNRDAVGARVYLEREDGLIQNQMVKAGNSYQSTSSKSLFFGLGTSNIKTLTVEWPSGNTDVFENLPVNEILHIREGDAAGQPAELVNFVQ